MRITDRVLLRYRHSREGGNPMHQKMDARLRTSGMTNRNSCANTYCVMYNITASPAWNACHCERPYGSQTERCAAIYPLTTRLLRSTRNDSLYRGLSAMILSMPLLPAPPGPHPSIALFKMTGKRSGICDRRMRQHPPQGGSQRLQFLQITCKIDSF